MTTLRLQTGEWQTPSASLLGSDTDHALTLASKYAKTRNTHTIFKLSDSEIIVTAISLTSTTANKADELFWLYFFFSKELACMIQWHESESSMSHSHYGNVVMGSRCPVFKLCHKHATAKSTGSQSHTHTHTHTHTANSAAQDLKGSPHYKRCQGNDSTKPPTGAFGFLPHSLGCRSSTSRATGVQTNKLRWTVTRHRRGAAGVVTLATMTVCGALNAQVCIWTQLSKGEQINTLNDWAVGGKPFSKCTMKL